MTRRSVETLLEDIVLWGGKLARHVDGFTLESFLDDDRTMDAASRCIEVVGEASRRLMRADPLIGARHPDLALLDASDTRNRLAHGYFDVDGSILWRTATRSVPEIVAQARRVVAARRGGAKG